MRDDEHADVNASVSREPGGDLCSAVNPVSQRSDDEGTVTPVDYMRRGASSHRSSASGATAALSAFRAVPRVSRRDPAEVGYSQVGWFRLRLLGGASGWG